MSSLLENDAGFCSGSSEHEDDHQSHDDLHSPTDASEDSVEVKFTPILKNKRKSSEPLRIVPDPDSQGPLKKRFRYEEGKAQGDLHRPWALAANPADILLRHPGVTTLHRPHAEQLQEEPLALISKSPLASSSAAIGKKSNSKHSSPQEESSIESLIKKTQIDRVHATQLTSNDSSTIQLSSLPQALSKPKSNQRNYKNMTRERRIEANARERSRVHTISAAYDTLRHAIPSYASTQKLSKLSVLRIACSYIMTLSRLAGEDFSADQSEPPVEECVDAVTRTIQTEGKLRRKKDE